MLKFIDEWTLTNQSWINMDITLTDATMLFQHISTLNQRWVFTGIYLTMILFVYKRIRQAKLFCIYDIALYYRIVFVLFILKLSDFLPVRKHNFFRSLFLEGNNIQNFDYLFRASQLLSTLLKFSTNLRSGARAIKLLIKKICNQKSVKIANLT